MSDLNGGPLTAEEAQKFMQFVERNKRFGQVAFKTEAGKITRVTVEHNLLPHEVRQMMRA